MWQVVVNLSNVSEILVWQALVTATIVPTPLQVKIVWTKNSNLRNFQNELDRKSEKALQQSLALNLNIPAQSY